MKNAINKIFIGLLFIIIDLNMNNIDIMPNFIGAIFIIVGLNSLKYLDDEKKYFSKAKSRAWNFLIVCILNIIIFNNYVDFSEDYPVLNLIFAVVTISINIMIYYNLIKGIVTYIVADYNSELNEKFRRILNLFLIVGSGQIIVVSLALNINNSVWLFIFAITVTLVALGTEISFLRAINKLKNYCLNLS